MTEQLMNIEKKSVNVFDHFKDNEYKLFSDCKKLEAIFKDKNKYKVIGKGTYGTIHRYCLNESCSTGYVIKKQIEVDYPNNPNDGYWVSLRMGYLLNLFVKEKFTPHILPTLANFTCKDTHSLSYATIFPLAKENFNMLLDKKEIWAEKNSKSFLLNFLFQIIFTLAAIQKVFPSFRHNDLHTANIIYEKSSDEGNFLYTIDDMNFRLPNIGFRLIIIDLDYACIPELIDNEKMLLLDPRFNISDAPVNSYDVDMFLTYVKYTFSNQKNDVFVKFIDDFISEKDFVVSKSSNRPTTNRQYKSPLQYLREKFNIFRVDKTEGNYIDKFNANGTFPVLETSNLADNFTKCFTKAAFLPKDGNYKTMPDYIISKHCNKRKEVKIKINVDLDLDESIVLINNLTDHKITEKDMNPLINFIGKELVLNNNFYILDDFFSVNKFREFMDYAVIAKFFVYFTLETPTIFISNVFNQITSPNTEQTFKFLYNQIVINKDLVERYFSLKDTK